MSFYLEVSCDRKVILVIAFFAGRFENRDLPLIRLAILNLWRLEVVTANQQQGCGFLN